MHDVIVCDEEFESASAEIRKACRKIDWIVSLYLQIMEKDFLRKILSMYRIHHSMEKS